MAISPRLSLLTIKQSMNTQQSLHAPLKFILALACLIIIVAGLKLSADLVIPILLAIFIAVVLTPLTTLLNRYVPLGLSVLIVIIFLVLLVVLLGNTIGSTLSNFNKELPGFSQSVNSLFIQWIDWLNNHGISIDRSVILSKINPGSVTRIVTNLLGQIGSFFSIGLIVIFSVMFLLLEIKSYNYKLKLAAKDPDTAINTSKTIISSLRKYLGIKTMTSLITGIAVGILCQVLGVKFALLWGLIAFLLNFIPNIGSILAAIPAVLLSLVDTNLSLTITGVLIAGYMVINICIGSIIEPRVMGKGMGLSVFVAFFSLIFWGWIFGIVGMFLSVPLTMTIKTILSVSPSTKGIAIMLSDETPK